MYPKYADYASQYSPEFYEAREYKASAYHLTGRMDEPYDAGRFGIGGREGRYMDDKYDSHIYDEGDYNYNKDTSGVKIGALEKDVESALADPYNIGDMDSLDSCSFNECTGLMAAGPGKPEELAGYEEIYKFGGLEI